jgi:hypothetical protein
LRPVALISAIAAAGIVVGLIFAAHGGRRAAPAARATHPPASAGVAPTTPPRASFPQWQGSFNDAGPAQLIPRSGAYLGAFVQPPGRTSSGALITAVTAFEHDVGHRLGVVHVYHPWGAAFPSAADKYFASTGSTLLITWGGTPDTLAIVAGHDDAMIRARAEAIKRLGRPVLLEFRHEMDRPDLQPSVHSPTDYIAAWDHIRAIFAAVGADNVGWVWCPTAQGFADGRAEAYYPGDGEVNWICVDAYSTSPLQLLSSVVRPFLAWASHHPKPILIGEFGVRSDPPGWRAWLAQVGQFAHQDPQVKSLAYFDADGLSSQGRPYEFSLNGNRTATSAFAALLAQSYFSAPQTQTGDGQ